MLKVLLHRFLRDVTRAPCPVADGPKVPPPVPLPKRRIFLLQPATRAPFQPLDQVRQRLRRRVLDMHMHVVFADYALENPHVLSVTDLHEQVPAAHFDVAFEHVVAVLRDPDDVRCQARAGVPAVSVVCHGRDFYHAVEVCSN